jgi:hypothetical protein
MKKEALQKIGECLYRYSSNGACYTRIKSEAFFLYLERSLSAKVKRYSERAEPFEAGHPTHTIAILLCFLET